MIRARVLLRTTWALCALIAALKIATVQAVESAAPRCDVYVDSVSGVDGPRIHESLQVVPWKTLGAARDAIRQLARPLPLGGLVVCVAPGLYPESLVFDSRDSGDGPDRKVQWVGGVASSVSPAGATAAATELTAGVRVTFTPPPQGAPPLTPWTASLPAWGITDVGVWQSHGFLQKGGCVDAPLEFFSDGPSPGFMDAPSFGTPYTVARWPNVANPTVPYSEWTDEASWDRAAFVSGSDTMDSALYVSDDAPFGKWSASLEGGDVYWSGYPFFDWADGSVSALRFNASSHLLTLTPGTLGYNVTVSAKYFMQNAREALDVPFEYWVDPVTATLYFIPPSGTAGPLHGWVSNASNASVALLLIENASHLSFVDITVSFARGDGISVSNSHGITLLNVSVIGVGVSGISLSYSEDTVVAGANVSHCGGSGITAYGGGSRSTLESSGVVVVDSTVTHIGRRCMSYYGGITLSAVGAVSAFNAISGTPHIGSNVATNDGLFEYNVLTDTVLASCDMAAFYLISSDRSVWNITVCYSAFYRTGYGDAGCNMQSGNDLSDIYLDGEQSGVAMYGNVHWIPAPPHVQSYLSRSKKMYALFVNGGNNALVANSIVVDANVSYYNSIHGLAGSYAHVCAPNGSYIAGMRAMAWNTGVYAEHYPALAALQAGCDSGPEACSKDATCPAAPFGCSILDMVDVNVTQPIYLAENATVFDPANFNISGQWLGLDPGFQAGSLAAARASLNFQLATDSPVYAALPRFQRIPTECMGPYACPNLTVPYPRAATLRDALLRSRSALSSKAIF